MQVVTARFTFEAAHDLRGQVPDDHKCARVHGHSYGVYVEVASDEDDPAWIVDYAEIDRVYRECVHSVLDHQWLNDVPGLQPSTSERLVQWVRDALRPHLPGLCCVRIQETAKYGSEWRR